MMMPLCVPLWQPGVNDAALNCVSASAGFSSMRAEVRFTGCPVEGNHPWQVEICLNCHSLFEILLIYGRKYENKNTSQAVKNGMLQKEKRPFTLTSGRFSKGSRKGALAANALGRLCSGEYMFLAYSWGSLYLHTSQCEGESKQTKSGRLSHLPFRARNVKYPLIQPFKNLI